ncbi:MAG TPA: efflux transporter outer membrane subunit, partial [Gammaproteobacteria bacterium]|nr:efflux transporter outer membrane subunit [Gammaproteobacteria bacterium]
MNSIATLAEQSPPPAPAAGSRRARAAAPLRAAAVCISAALLAGCASYAGIEPQAHLAAAPAAALVAPRLDAEGSKQTVRGPWPDADWWRAFDDPTLDCLIEEGLADTPSLGIAAARLRRTEAQAEGARAGLRPGLSAAVGAQRERLSAHGMVPPALAGHSIDFADGGIGFRYELDFWNRNEAALAASLSEAAAARAEAAEARLVLSSSVAVTWFRLRYALEEQAIAREALDRRLQIGDLAAERTRAGLDSAVSAREAQAEADAARTEVIAADHRVTLLRDGLAALLGKGPEAAAALGALPKDSVRTLELPEVMPADLLARRPDIAASRQRVEAAAARIKVARAEFLPDINLAAAVGLQSLDLSSWLDASS